MSPAVDPTTCAHSWTRDAVFPSRRRCSACGALGYARQALAIRGSRAPATDAVAVVLCSFCPDPATGIAWRGTTEKKVCARHAEAEKARPQRRTG